jgi:CO/xanthine dehydrogenase FAD-binding subunit
MIRQAAEIAAELEPIEDIHGTSAYRRHLARVLTERALQEARGRIPGNTRAAA